jgi:hypothetical protein
VVNGAARNGRTSDTSPRRTEIRLRERAAVGGGKASKGRRRIARISVRNGVKRGEPQDRQRPEIRSQGRGGVNRRGGEKPRGRIAVGNGFPIRRTERGAETPRGSCPERGLSGLNDGGAIFGQPHERKPGLRTGWQGPERVGNRRQGQEGRAHLNVSEDERPGRWSSKTRARRRARRSRRAAVNGQGAATSTGIFPATGGTCRRGAWR